MTELLDLLQELHDKLYELGAEWTLGPLVLAQVLDAVQLGRPTLDIAVHRDDISDRLIETCRRLGIERIFVVINRGFSSRCVYAWSLPCISPEDVLLSAWLSENAQYREVVRSILDHISVPNLDWAYIRNMCLRLGIYDQVRQFLSSLKPELSRYLV